MGLALELMLEALGDAKGLAWVPDWPGTARMGWIALPSGGSIVLLGSRDPGNGQSGRWICHFLAVLYTYQHKTISNKTRSVDCHNIEGPVRTALLPRSLVAPSKEGPADIC